MSCTLQLGKEEVSKIDQDVHLNFTLISATVQSPFFLLVPFPSNSAAQRAEERYKGKTISLDRGIGIPIGRTDFDLQNAFMNGRNGS